MTSGPLMHQHEVKQMTRQPDHPTDTDFQRHLELHLRGPVLAYLEEACSYANAHGYRATLAAVADTQLQLSLHDKQGANSTYRIAGDVPNQRIVLEQHYANGDTHRQEVSLAALNETVIDTELAAFCTKAAGLRLGYLDKRHPVGFW